VTRRTNVVLSAAALALLAAASPSLAGITILVADRTAHKIWRLTDLNDNGVIESNEVFVWFDGSNTAGTPNIANLGALALRSTDNLVIGGDITSHQYYEFQDLNHDGDALDAGESRIVMTAANASGATTNVPSGVAFMANGDLLVDNSGSGTTTVFPDAIYRCHDTDANGDYQGAGEVTPWVADGPGGFGPGNSAAWVPQDMLIDATGVGYLRNAGGVVPGVYKFRDVNNSGRADDVGELTAWFTAANLSGVTVSAGFPLEPDTANPGSLYYLQVATGAIDQVYRLTDLDGNGDANGVGEAVLVYSTGEANFGSNDLLLLPGGDLLVSDVTGKRIIRLHDADGDGLFTSPGERTDFFLAGAGPVLDTRQMVRVRNLPLCGTADFDCNGDIGTDADINAFFACLSGTCPPPPCTNSADFNGDGDVGTDTDIEAFFRVLAGATC
jgi:hypothetical protein